MTDASSKDGDEKHDGIQPFPCQHPCSHPDWSEKNYDRNDVQYVADTALRSLREFREDSN